MMRILLVLGLLVCVTGCSGDQSLNGVFERQMQEDGATGYTVIHAEENEKIGVVMYTEADFPNEATLKYFLNSDGQWQTGMATSCTDKGVTKLGMMGNGYLTCSVLQEDWIVETIRVDGVEANLFDIGSGRKAWYLVTEEKSSEVVGVSPDGKEFRLN